MSNPTPSRVEKVSRRGNSYGNFQLVAPIGNAASAPVLGKFVRFAEAVIVSACSVDVGGASVSRIHKALGALPANR
jgi:hypothetical protein